VDTARIPLIARSRHPAVRAVCALVFVLSCALQLAGTALEQGGGSIHIRCAEHGELTHAAAGGPAAPVSPDAPSRIIARSGSGGAFSHDHCLLSAVLNRSTPAFKVDRPLVAAPEAAAPRPLVPRAVPHAEQRRLLAAAPKTSPPPS
jgi:hypothetical protein